MPNDTAEWRYTASSQEVVRTDGVLIAREVPPEFGAMVETAPIVLAALTCLCDVVGLTAFKHESQRQYLQQAVDEARAAIARARP